MRTRTITALVTLVAALAVVAVSSAITYGVPDGNGHPEVGALLAPQAYSDGTWATCTGTLIAPKVFLTAAHCDGARRVAVTFDSAYDSAKGTTYWGTWVADPATTRPRAIRTTWRSSCSTRREGITPARLPAAGSLANLRARSSSRRWATAPSRSRAGRAARRSTTATSATSQRDAECDHAELAADLAEPEHRQRRHVLRRLRRAELPRRRGDRDEHPRRHHDHGRHAVPLDERRLPARHALGSRVPGQGSSRCPSEPAGDAAAKLQVERELAPSVAVSR